MTLFEVVSRPFIRVNVFALPALERVGIEYADLEAAQVLNGHEFLSAIGASIVIQQPFCDARATEELLASTSTALHWIHDNIGADRTPEVLVKKPLTSVIIR